MNTPSHRIRFRILLAFLASASAALASTNLLTEIALPGESSFVQWTNLSFSNSSREPSAGSGTITSTASQLTSGFYSFSGDYTVTTATTASFDISNVVLQFTAMPNTEADEGGATLEGYFTYGGGPVLTYTLEGGGGGELAAAYTAIVAGPVYDSATTVPGNYYDFAWQWDLSSVVGTVVGVSILNNFPIHTSVTTAQLNVGDTFAGSAIPEPAACAAVAAGLALVGAWWRRRRTAR